MLRWFLRLFDFRDVFNLSLIAHHWRRSAPSAFSSRPRPRHPLDAILVSAETFLLLPPGVVLHLLFLTFCCVISSMPFSFSWRFSCFAIRPYEHIHSTVSRGKDTIHDKLANRSLKLGLVAECSQCWRVWLSTIGIVFEELNLREG